MRQLDSDSLPHLVYCLMRLGSVKWFTFWSNLLSYWWGVRVGSGCRFSGTPCFRRHPSSRIRIGRNCEFLSSHTSNLIGINRPCIVSTLTEHAVIEIGDHCGFSGTVIGCADKVMLGDHVRCGANTVITDTDWHTDDPRTTPNAAVRIEKGVWLGLNAIVLKGVTIGENTVVAAGSLVNKPLPPNVVAGGVPARILKHLTSQQHG